MFGSIVYLTEYPTGNESRMSSSLVAYAKKMGLPKAIRLYAAQKLNGSGEVSVQLPDLATPVWARYGTSDLGMFRQVLIDEEYRLQPGREPRLIIDAGANVGYASVYFANCFPGATIIAIEPDSGNFRQLQKNTAPYPRVRCMRAGLWGRDCFLKISNPEDGACAFRVEETADPKDALPAVTVSTLLRSSGLDRIDILKLDIEGAEKELFAARDSASWIERTDFMMIELHDRLVPGCEAALRQAVQGAPFTFSQQGEKVVLARQ